MKLKSTLWALAFACIAMSCSDDELTGSGSENEGGGGSATTAQMKVIISAGTGTSTKANEAEQGDNNEQGSYDEYQVKDIAVFLYEYTGSVPSSGTLNLAGTEKIVAMGYVENPSNQSTGHPTYHQWEATIKVTLTNTDLNNFANQNFGVIALTNITETSYNAIKEVVSNPTTNTVQHLADYLQSGIHTDNGFVMSTHMMDDTGADYRSGNHYSVVTFPSANSTEIPEVECYVERLAAKVRINKSSNATGGDYTYTVKDYTDPSNPYLTEDKVTLQQAVVINQLCSGEYLLKRVSSATHTDLDLSGTEGFTLLGDEQYTAASGSNPATGNFVGDPWIIRKTTTNASSSSTDNNRVVSFSSITAQGNVQTSASTQALSYKNHIAMTDGTADPQTLNYGAFWNALTTSETTWEEKQLKPKELTGTDPITLAYTMENTVNVANSVHAFMTGVMFKAKYVPKKVSAIKSDNKGVEEAEFSTSGDGTFYTRGNTKFASLDAIFAYELATNTATGSLYWNSFMPTAWSNLKAKDLKAFLDVNTMMDSFGYLKYLTDNWSSIVSSITDATTMGSLTSINSFNDYIDPSKNTTFSLPTNIKKYDKGTCYYFYWIRHEDNNDPLTVGPMEYAIVRNNIYDLTVSGISGLGEAAIDVPTPSEPAETKTATIQVTLKVRNWVVRKNNNIIL